MVVPCESEWAEIVYFIFQRFQLEWKTRAPSYLQKPRDIRPNIGSLTQSICTRILCNHECHIVH